MSGGICDDLLGVRPAGVAVQLRLHGGAGLGVGWPRGAAQGREDVVESAPSTDVVSQCQAVSRPDGAYRRAFSWLSNTSRASLESISGSLTRPR